MKSLIVETVERVIEQHKGRTEAAAAIGPTISRGHLIQWLRGVIPTDEHLIRLAELAGIAHESLIWEAFVLRLNKQGIFVRSDAMIAAIQGAEI